MGRNLIYILLLLIFHFSCDEPIVLDTQQVPSAIVIESHITTEDKLHNVKLSLSVDFYHDSKPPMIEDAIVFIRNENTGRVFNFYHTGSDNEYYEGLFVAEESFRARVGHTYELHVEYNGNIYTARETVLPVTDIESLSYHINNAEYRNPDKEGYYYEVLLNAREPQDTEDYYMFKFYRNDSLIFAREADLYFTDDSFFGEKIQNLPLPVFFSHGDKAKVEMHSITREAYVYLSDLIIVLNNDSGMFTPPPANPRNNITNGALGYFMLSDVSAQTIIID